MQFTHTITVTHTLPFDWNTSLRWPIHLWRHHQCKSKKENIWEEKKEIKGWEVYSGATRCGTKWREEDKVHMYKYPIIEPWRARVWYCIEDEEEQGCDNSRAKLRSSWTRCLYTIVGQLHVWCTQPSCCPLLSRAHLAHHAIHTSGHQNPYPSLLIETHAGCDILSWLEEWIKF